MKYPNELGSIFQGFPESLAVFLLRILTVVCCVLIPTEDERHWSDAKRRVVSKSSRPKRRAQERKCPPKKRIKISDDTTQRNRWQKSIGMTTGSGNLFPLRRTPSFSVNKAFDFIPRFIIKWPIRNRYFSGALKGLESTDVNNGARMKTLSTHCWLMLNDSEPTADSQRLVGFPSPESRPKQHRFAFVNNHELLPLSCCRPAVAFSTLLMKLPLVAARVLASESNATEALWAYPKRVWKLERAIQDGAGSRNRGIASIEGGTGRKTRAGERLSRLPPPALRPLGKRQTKSKPPSAKWLPTTIRPT